MRYILAHDLGTSGNKATLFSEDGRLIKSEVSSYDAHYFNDTWVEQNADDWWNAVCRTSSSLIQSTGVDPGEIGAISFSGQMMGCLCVDRNGTPLRPRLSGRTRGRRSRWHRLRSISASRIFTIS